MELKKATIQDLDDIFALEQLVWRDDSATYQSLAKRIQTFPEGFCVIRSNGSLVGMAMSALLPQGHQVVEYDESFFPWERVHNPKGNILYLYCSTVHPDFRRQGVWKKMLDFRLEYARKHPEILEVWVAGRNKQNQYGPNTVEPLQKVGFARNKDFLFKGEYTQTLMQLLPPYNILL